MIQRKMNKKDLLLLRRTLKYINPYRIKFIFAFLCIICNIGAGLVSPILWGQVLQKLFDNAYQDAIVYIILSFLLNLAVTGILYLQAYLFATLNQDIIFDLKRDIYDSMLHLPIKAYDDIENGEFMSRLHGDAGQVANAVTNIFVNTIVDIIRMIAIGIVTLCVSVRLALIALLSFPVSYWISNIYGKRIRKKNEEFAKANDKYFGRTGEDIWGIREIKGLGIESGRYEDYLKTADGLKKKTISITLVTSWSQFLSNGINNLAVVAVMLMGAKFIYEKSLTIPLYVAMITYISQFSTSLINSSRVKLYIQQIMTSLERIFLLIDGMGYKRIKSGDRILKSKGGNVDFEHVTFHYKEGEEVLHDVSFHIPSNKKTAFVGSSGSGKTTIFNLILDFYEPADGKVKIDGVDLRDVKTEELRNYISVVQQDPFLFTMTIEGNLKLANQEATKEEIESACKKAFIHDYIISLPDGYQTNIGENGVSLSGGQRQRLAIARALLKRSKIILFDEATSALDNESQFYIKHVMEEMAKECTVITIAHRLSTIIESDIIYVVEQGNIVGCGTHQSLLASNQIYQKLYKKEVDLINDNSREEIAE